MMEIQNLGTQMVECARIARLVGKHGESFLERVYSSEEIRLCAGSKHSTQLFAVHWACKEAILKMLEVEDRGRFDWREVEIAWNGGACGARLKGSLEERAKQKRIRKWWISCTYTRNYAVATVIALTEGDGA